MTPAVVRPTRPDDRGSVLELVRSAFSDATRDGQEEVDIVEQTWARAPDDEVVDLVAERDGDVVGHVLGAPGSLGAAQLLAVAPLAVAPADQRDGIGSQLMTELLRRAEEAGWPAVVLLGNPDYYGRFGFEPAGAAGVVYPPVDPELPFFQIRPLSRWSPSLQGSFVYCWEA